MANQCIWHPKTTAITADELHIWSRMFNTHPLVISMMYNRGIQSEEEMSSFLFLDSSSLRDPFLLPDMKKSVTLMIKSIRKKEKIAVFGDYDVDGVTATALLVKGLRFFGADVIYRVPLREEGYGLSASAVEEFYDQGVSLIITVDNGSTALDAAHRAKELGITLIISDHHQLLPSGEHPPCAGFINHQRRDGNPYPFPHLCGAAIAYKIVQALFSFSQRSWSDHYYDFLELAALGSVADMMPLCDENRTLVSLGLKKMQQDPSMPLTRLFSALKLSPRFLTSSDIGFRIAPIFNAAGRIADPHIAIHYLLGDRCDDDTLRQLLAFNEERKMLTQQQTQLAEQIIAVHGYDQHNILVVQGEFSDGVMGIVASRLSDSYSRPCIVLTMEGKGSARSGPHDFSIVDAISSCSHHLIRFGGHRAAAGLQVIPDQMEAFRQDMQHTFTLPSMFVRKREYDFALSMNKFPMYLRSELQLLEPFGIGNPQPCFFSPETVVEQMVPFGKSEEHLKFIVEGRDALLFSGNKNRIIPRDLPHYRFLYTPSAAGKLQFVVHDIEAS